MPPDKINRIAVISEKDKQLSWFVVGFILLGLVLRVFWAYLVPVVPVSDGNAYDIFANNLASHGVFGWTADEPGIFWPPGTTFLHALAYCVLGFEYSSIVVLNILLSVGIIVCSARAANSLYGPTAACVTSLVLAVWPSMIMYVTILASELPYLFFTILALDIWVSKSNTIILKGILCGFLLGFASLVRPLALLLPIIYGVSVFASSGFKSDVFRKQMKIVLISLVVTILTVTPWSLRNYIIFEEPVLISTNGAITLWMGNTPGSKGAHMPIPADLKDLPHPELSEILKGRALNYILNDPYGFVERFARKVVLLYGNESIAVVWNAQGISSANGTNLINPLKWLTRISWALIFVISIFGFYALLKKFGAISAVLSPFVLTSIYYTFAYGVTVAQDRYHLSYATNFAVLFSIAIIFLFKNTSLNQKKVDTESSKRN